MTFTFRPAVRENTPLIIGIAGPTKSGKTYSAHRLAAGLSNGGIVAMINAEGARGHQYADKFNYMGCDITPPYSPERYEEVLKVAQKLSPAVIIIDSGSHMHDGPGGLLEMHDAQLDRMAGNDYKKREKCTWSAWIEPKKQENSFIYAMLQTSCPIILCLRAKEKIKIVSGKQPVDLGWQPIASDRISFETIFTLVLPPHCKGVPDLEISEMREPFDSMVKPGMPIDESLGERLLEWAAGGAKTPSPVSQGQPTSQNAAAASDSRGITYITEAQQIQIREWLESVGISVEAFCQKSEIASLDYLAADRFNGAMAWIKRQPKGGS